MIKINQHIEIVRSSNTRLSSLSLRSCDAILAILNRHYSDVRVATVNTLSDLEALVSRRPDLVFLGMKFVPVNQTSWVQDGLKIWLSAYLDEHNIAYTGSMEPAHQLEYNKTLAKKCIFDDLLRTAPYCVALQTQPQDWRNMLLSFPVFIKPTDRGGGLGIDSASVAHNFDELESKVQSIATNLHSDSLIEEYLPGREFSVAILQNENAPGYLVMPIELIAPIDKLGARLLSGIVKSSDSEQAIEIIDPTIKSEIIDLAIQSFNSLGARDYGRIDIRLDKAGIPHFLEANLIPSLIENYGSFPKACLINFNLDQESIILRIVRLGLARNIKTDDILDTPDNVIAPVLEPAFNI